VVDEGCDVFLPGERHFLPVSESPGVFVRVTLDDDRLGCADRNDQLNDMLLDRLDRSLDGFGQAPGAGVAASRSMKAKMSNVCN